ncbi:MAG: bifunctional serine/threonine-protein kinase/formylglycine-generating enzyme family protein [Byssovorax sp.]
MPEPTRVPLPTDLPSDAGSTSAVVESGITDHRGADRPLLPGRYRDLGLLARGAFGEVRRVHDTLLDRAVAMKVLHGEHTRDHLRKRFLAEARITARLDHPGIVALFDRGETPDGRLWFTMKEVRGATLREAIDALHEASRPEGFRPMASGWTFRRLIEAFSRIAQAIAHAHGRGILHRDLKPDNLMVGELGEVLVMDWGLGRDLSLREEESVDEAAEIEVAPGLTRHGDVLGTPAYMPPEQARGETALHGPASDVYALGAVLYHLLAGRPPYAGTSAEILASIARGVRPLPPRAGRKGAPVPAELAELAMRAMSPTIGDRPTAEALAGEVVAWLDGAKRREQAEEAVRRARAIEPEIAALRARVGALRAEAREGLDRVRSFDGVDKKAPSWALEDEAAALDVQAALRETEWMEALHGALTIDPDLPEAHAALAEPHKGALLAAERARRAAEAAQAEALLRAHDRGRFASLLRGEGALTLVTDPPGAEVWLSRYALRGRRLVEEDMGLLGVAPLRGVPLQKGSYLLRIRAPGRSEVLYPIRIERGEHWDGVAPGESEPRPILLPEEGEIGPDEALIPAGYALIGGDPEAPDGLVGRRIWVDSFVIGRYPVTSGEYLGFLNDLCAQGQSDKATIVCPRSDLALSTSVESRSALPQWGKDGRFHPPPDWSDDLPIVLVDWHGAMAYARWKAEKTGRPYRLLNELEREKAARGADGRFLPWGDHPEPTFSRTSESQEEAAARVSIHAYPTDESPYGVRGLAGNVRDWCMNTWKLAGPTVESDRLRLDPAGADDPDFRAIRGGAWGSATAGSRAASRFGARPAHRGLGLGLRIGRRFPRE